MTLEGFWYTIKLFYLEPFGGVIVIRLFEHYIRGEKVYSEVVDPVCKKYNLTHMEFNIIMFLYNNPKYNTQALICKYKKLTKSHVSVSVQTLIDKHLITKDFEGDNKKTLHLHLLDTAVVIARAGKVKQEEFVNVVLKGFSVDERRAFYSYLNRIEDNLKGYEGEEK